MANGGMGDRLRRMLPRTLQRAPARPPGGEIAASSIGNRLAPYIGELPAHPRLPARYADSWRDEIEALRIYRDTLKDERCQAALDQRLDAAISRPWEVEPGGDDERDKAAAEDLKMQLEAIDFDATCRQLLHGVWYGYAVAEAIWSRDEGRIVLADLIVRAPDRFRWSPEGEPLLRTERTPLGEAVPPGKFVVLARPGEHGDLPHGRGIARWCFWPVWLKRNGLRFWAVSLEKFGAPTVVGKYSPNATSEEKARLLELVQAYATSLGITLPEGQEIEIVESARRAGGDFKEFVGYLDRMVTTTILGQSSTTDQGPWRGTAEVQKDVRDETVAADCRLLDSALNATIARWLTAWNFPGAAVPRIRRDTSPPEDLDARATREEVIARTTGLRPTMAHVTGHYGGEWEVAPAPATAPGQPGESPMGGERAMLARASARSEDDEIARLAAEAVGLAAPASEAMVDAVRALVDRAQSLDEVSVGLLELSPEIDLDDYAEAARSAFVLAELMGRADLIDGR